MRPSEQCGAEGNKVMQAVHKSFRGLGLMVELNLDRLLFLLAIATALAAGAFLSGL